MSHRGACCRLQEGELWAQPLHPRMPGGPAERGGETRDGFDAPRAGYGFDKPRESRESPQTQSGRESRDEVVRGGRGGVPCDVPVAVGASLI